MGGGGPADTVQLESSSLIFGLFYLLQTIPKINLSHNWTPIIPEFAPCLLSGYFVNLIRVSGRLTNWVSHDFYIDSECLCRVLAAFKIRWK